MLLKIGQSFMTEDAAEFSQFRAVACREYTLPGDERSFTTKRTDPRKHQNWTRVGNGNLLVAR